MMPKRMLVRLSSAASRKVRPLCSGISDARNRVARRATASGIASGICGAKEDVTEQWQARRHSSLARLPYSLPPSLLLLRDTRGMDGRDVAGMLPSWPSPPPLRRPAVPVASLAPVWDLREPRGPREGLAGPWRRCDALEAARGVHGPHSACTRRGAAYKKHLRPFLPPCLML